MNKLDSVKNFIALIKEQYGVTLQEEIVIDELQMILQEKVAKIVKAQYEKHTIEALCDIIGTYFTETEKKIEEKEKNEEFEAQFEEQTKPTPKKRTRKPKTLN
jgi:hypothetical protein